MNVTRKGGFFNNQTTDKCGRLITGAKDFGLLAQELSVLTQQNVTGFSDLVSQFSESDRSKERAVGHTFPDWGANGRLSERDSSPADRWRGSRTAG